MSEDWNIHANRLFSCIDHTSLCTTDSESTISKFCQRALELKDSAGEHVYAVCVYLPYISVARRALQGSGIKVAVVAGAFPHGQMPLSLKVSEVQYAIDQGADEVDIVINRGLVMSDDRDGVIEEVKRMKEVCGDKILKVILETCDLPSPTLISKAARWAMEGGADFIKTSTGKGKAGAELSSAEIMLKEIKAYQETYRRTIGFKAAGGIRTPKQACDFASLASRIMGESYINPHTFRIGASSLTENLLVR